MHDNPYESPQSPPEPHPLSEDAKEWLGIAKQDFWYYPGFLLLVAACFFSNVWIVAVLFFVSTGFLLIFLAKSIPKYARSQELAVVTRLFGFIGGIALILLQLGVIFGKTWFLFWRA